jgi:adenosylmethionine-8-amino-7-oxononanoate aminotransferase
MAEPIQGAGGVIIPPAQLLAGVKRIFAERDILFVADEVICRLRAATGEWFGSTVYGHGTGSDGRRQGHDVRLPADGRRAGA